MLIDPQAAEDFKYAQRLHRFVKDLKKQTLDFFGFRRRAMSLMRGDHELMADPNVRLVPEYYNCKYLLGKLVAGRRIVEIGVKAGLSAWTFMTAHRPESYVGYDIYAETTWALPVAKGVLTPMAERVTINRRDSQGLKSVEEADFYHVDGLHTREGTCHDLCVCYDSAPDGAAILVDDVMCGPDVIAGVHDFARRKDCYPIFFKDLRGEALFFKNVPHPSRFFMLQSTFPQEFI